MNCSLVSKYILALGFVISFSAAEVFAQTPSSEGNCPPLSDKLDLTLPDEDIRAQNLSTFKYSRCRYKEIRDNSERVKSIADKDVFGWLDTYYETFIKLASTRETYPGKQIHERMAKSERFKDNLAAWRDMITYIELSKGIYVEENCPHEKVGDYCVGNPWLQMVKAQGKDWHQELERTAHAKRPLGVDPWFLMGDVIVDDSELSEKSYRLRHANDDAKKDYDTTKETRDLRWQQLAEAAITHEKNARALREPVKKLKRRITDIEERNRPSAEEVTSSKQYKNLRTREKKILDRLEKIEIAIDYFFEHHADDDDEFAEERKRVLGEEEAALEAELGRIPEQIAELKLPQLNTTDRDALKALRDELDLLERDAERRVKVDKGDYLSAKRLYLAAEERHVNADRAHAKADIELREFLEGTIYSVTSVWTNDATILLEQSSITEVLKIMNADIKDHELILNQAQEVRERSRKAMIDASLDVENSAASLAIAGYRSVAAQLGVEIVEATIDLAMSAKGGPAGVLFEAVGQISGNVLFPPNYYDFEGGRLEDYFKGNAQGLDVGVMETIVQNPWEKGTAKELGTKAVANHFFGNIPRESVSANHLKKLIKNAETEILSEQLRGGPDALARARKLLEDTVPNLQKKLLNTNTALDVISGQKGMSEFGRKVGLNVGLSVAKSFVKEELKRVATLIEQPAYDEYMRAQVRLAAIVALFRTAGNDYWRRKQIVETKRLVRDALIEGFNPETGQFEEENEPFFADPGYQIALDLNDEAKGRFNAELTLEGVPLERDTRRSTPVWKLPENSLDLFTTDMPERLELRILLK